MLRAMDSMPQYSVIRTYRNDKYAFRNCFGARFFSGGGERTEKPIGIYRIVIHLAQATDML